MINESVNSDIPGSDGTKPASDPADVALTAGPATTPDAAEELPVESSSAGQSSSAESSSAESGDEAAADEAAADSPDLTTSQPVADESSEAESSATEDDGDAADATAEDAGADDDAEDDMDVEPLELIEEADEDDQETQKDWYILKVQVNREQSICEALQRRIKVAGLDRFIGDILVPTEDVREFTKSGKQKVVKRKLYPGYIVVNMAINDDTWFLVRETPGIGDFTGSAGKPTPMAPQEIDRILRLSRPPDDQDSKDIKSVIKFKQGDRVRVKDGHFQNFEGEIDTIDETHGRVTVMINIFGRPTPVELEHWQVEDV